MLVPELLWMRMMNMVGYRKEIEGCKKTKDTDYSIKDNNKLNYLENNNKIINNKDKDCANNNLEKIWKLAKIKKNKENL